MFFFKNEKVTKMATSVRVHAKIGLKQVCQALDCLEIPSGMFWPLGQRPTGNSNPIGSLKTFQNLAYLY